MILLLASVTWGLWLATLAADVLGTVKAWGMAPALLDRRPGLPAGWPLSVASKVAHPLRRSDPVVWEEIAYSLAFHLRAGETTAQAVKAVSAERDTAPYTALKRACQAYDAGTPLLSALNAEARHSGELAYLGGIFDMGAVSGGDLPALFCHAAEAMRRRRLMRGEARAKLGEARATAVLLSLLPWLIGLYTFGQDPSVKRMVLSDPKGAMLLVVSLAFWLAGNVAVLFVLRSLSTRDTPGKTGGRKP